jgi:Family of unknown function (DUF5682)
VEGFLQGSGLLLIHDDRLLRAIDRWVRSLGDDAFVRVLPLLRRTFATFEPAERRQIGEKLRRTEAAGAVEVRCDRERGELVLPIIGQIFQKTS